MTTPSTNVNDTFFDGIYKDVWRGLIHPGISEAECDFLKDVAHLEKGDNVLDLMCGYGRHALELARRGFPVTAIDNSADYIKEINAVSQTESLPVEAFAAGALQVELLKQYSAAICMGNSFAFFNREDATTLLKKIASCLIQQGTLLINSWMIAEIAIRHFREKDWYALDGFKYLLSNKFCFQPGRIESEHTIISEKGQVEIIYGIDYIFTLSELESMFKEAGLKTKGLYSTPRKKPFRIGDSTIYIVAEKI
jgi:cyclopropane fatty-acyl-phospholipid synthase-like methyltransferase